MQFAYFLCTILLCIKYMVCILETSTLYNDKVVNRTENILLLYSRFGRISIVNGLGSWIIITNWVHRYALVYFEIEVIQHIVTFTFLNAKWTLLIWLIFSCS